MINPVASTSVVINGAESTAGSTPKRCARIGTNDPTVVDQTQIANIVTATVIASASGARQKSACTNAIGATSKPSNIPVVASRATTRQACRTPTSPSARLRITVITVCAPALPPVPISNGMKNASATTAASSDSNLCKTALVSVPATNSNNSQPTRLRTTRMIG